MHESAFGGFSAKREREREAVFFARVFSPFFFFERKTRRRTRVCFVKEEEEEEEECERVLFASFEKNVGRFVLRARARRVSPSQSRFVCARFI